MLEVTCRKAEGKGQSKEGAGDCLFTSRDKDNIAGGAETRTRRVTHDMGLRQFDAMKDDASLIVQSGKATSEKHGNRVIERNARGEPNGA
jgi:hypothetical protein